ncbi:MAG: NAD(P)/FAD-dependent oxidoreductase [Proteobacteria bacterium]|nr:NAD(P)/FAD-dependent oxidoreductase [Pseudomonadota bacterium]MBU1688575.1 NAD(P)/FAD-dependent oxidoreductase [Pseudomonadota bacterium]
MTEIPDGAILQRDKKTVAIVPRIPVGLLTPETLEGLAKVIREYKIPITKITSGQRLALVGIKPEDVEAIWASLGTGVGRATELCLHYVQACPGNAVCKFGTQDSLGLGRDLEKMLISVETPAKMKIGVSGCSMCCAESYLRDIGLIGKKNGWLVTFGGNGGAHPRVADEIAADLSLAQAVDLVKKLVNCYRKHGKKRERTARFVERVGIDDIRQEVLA